MKSKNTAIGSVKFIPNTGKLSVFSMEGATQMGYRFITRCLLLCLICMISGALLPFSTAYAAGPLRIYAFQVTRPDPNRPESKGQVVQAVRIKYNLDDSGFPDPIVKCVKTPDQNWQSFKSTKSFKFGSPVEFKLY